MTSTLWPRLQPVALCIAVSALVLALLFHTEIAAAVRVWDSSTAYGHCWLILPIALFLAYERREQAAAAVVAPNVRLAFLAVPLIGLWLVADLLGIMEGRQLAVIGFLEVLLLAALGWVAFSALAAALLYLVFLVPFGAFITPALQGFTTSFIVHGLDVLRIAHRETGNTIDIPEGAFYVAEACAGLRFLIASIAFGVLYALTMFTSPLRRLAFVAASVVVPILANGLRALGIVVLGHELGSADAAATDHLLYGWIFFSLVIAALAVLGLPFRQDAPAPPQPAPLPPPGTARRAVFAVWPALLLAAAGPAAAFVLAARAVPPGAPAPILLAPKGCGVTSSVSGNVLQQAFTCGATVLNSRTLLLPRGANPSGVVTVAQAQAALLLPNVELDRSVLTVDGTPPTRWTLDLDQRGDRGAATALFIDGAETTGGLHDRLRLARDMLGGGGEAPAIVCVAVMQGAGDPVRVLADFLAGQGDIAARVSKP